MNLDLGVAEDDLVSCVACGLCLPHCPTWRVTGEEANGPRGRIAAMKRVAMEGAPADDAFVGFMEACVQCRGCEAACPSGVPFGRMMEHTRAAITSAAPATAPTRARRIGMRMLAHHGPLLAASTLGAVAQRLGLLRPGLANALGLPAGQRLPLRRPPKLRSSGDDVWFFPGCVMDAWLRDTHHSAVWLLQAAGAGVSIPSAAGGAGCCGALALHSGQREDARRMAERVMRSMPGEQPVLVDSAGCGAQLKELGHLVGTSEAEAFAARVLDVGEWLATQIDRLPHATVRLRDPIVVQDPCHLRHVQKAHLPVRGLLALVADDVRELADDGLCCGAGGAYATEQPELAAAVRDRKVASITAAAGPDPLVVSANPGCALHLAGAGLRVEHYVDVVARGLGRPA